MQNYELSTKQKKKSCFILFHFLLKNVIRFILSLQDIENQNCMEYEIITLFHYEIWKSETK